MDPENAMLPEILGLFLLTLILWPVGLILWAKDRLSEHRQQKPEAPRIRDSYEPKLTAYNPVESGGLHRRGF